MFNIVSPVDYGRVRRLSDKTEIGQHSDTIKLHNVWLPLAQPPSNEFSRPLAEKSLQLVWLELAQIDQSRHDPRAGIDVNRVEPKTFWTDSTPRVFGGGESQNFDLVAAGGQAFSHASSCERTAVDGRPRRLVAEDQNPHENIPTTDVMLMGEWMTRRRPSTRMSRRKDHSQAQWPIRCETMPFLRF